MPLPAAPPWSTQRPNVGSGQMQGALWIAGGASQQGTPDKQVWVYAPPSNTPDTGQIFPYDQGPGGGQMLFAVECNGFAYPTRDDPGAESYVSFTSDTRDASGQYVTLPRTKIAQNRFLAGVQAQVPGNWKAKFAVKCSSNRARTNFQIQFIALFSGGGI